MRFRLDALLKPIDPVVAVHPSSRAADDSLAMLQRAGFHRSDLTVIGQGDSRTDLADLANGRRAGASHWAASGTGLGLLWAAFTIATVLLLPLGGAAFAALVTLGTLTLLLQAAVMSQVVAPASEAAATLATGSARSPVNGQGSQAWRFLVVVRGSRSDVALARALLSAG